MNKDNKLKAVEKMDKGMSVVWYTPANCWDKYVKICKRYNYDWKAEDFWFKDDIKKFGRFLEELRNNNIIVMSAN